MGIGLDRLVNGSTIHSGGRARDMDTTYHTVDVRATAWHGIVVTAFFTEGSSLGLPDGLSISRGVPPAMSQAQAYYWTSVWQAGEQETLAELEAGRGITFDDPKEAIRWLVCGPTGCREHKVCSRLMWTTRTA